MGDHNIPLKTLCTTSNFLSISFRFWDYYPPKMGVVPQICLKLQIPYYHPPRTNKPCYTLHAPMLHAMHTSVTCYTHYLHPHYVLCTPSYTAHPCYGPHASCYMLRTPVACYSHSYYTLSTLITYYVHLHALPLLCTTCTLLHAMHTPITHYMHPHYVLCAPSLWPTHTHYKLCAPCYILYTHPYYELHTL